MAEKITREWGDWTPPRDIPSIGTIAPTNNPVLDENPIIVQCNSALLNVRAVAHKALDVARAIHGDDTMTIPGRHLLAHDKATRCLEPGVKALAKTLDSMDEVSKRLESETRPKEPRHIHTQLATAVVTALMHLQPHERRSSLASGIKTGDELLGACLFNLPHFALGITPSDREQLQLEYRHARWPSEWR